MSKILTAEDKLNKFYNLIRPHINGHRTAQNLFFEALKQIELDKQAYHKAKVESVTDEEIKEELFVANERDLSLLLKGAKWLKQKLLEQ